MDNVVRVGIGVICNKVLDDLPKNIYTPSKKFINDYIKKTR